MSKKNFYLLLMFLILGVLSSIDGLSKSFAQATNTAPKQQKPAKEKATEKVKEPHRFKVQFLDPIPLSQLNIKSVPECTKMFIQVCGEPVFPQITEFTYCLDEKYDSFKTKTDCAQLAHAVIHAGFISGMNRAIPQCRVFFEKCELVAKKDKRIGIQGCVLREPKLPQICYKLTKDTYTYRTQLARIFNTKMAPDLNFKK